jgi:hypothetical protein
MTVFGMLPYQVINEAAQEALGLRRMKTIDLDAMTVGDHGGEAAHLVPPGDAHVLVGIDIGEQKAAIVRSRQPL